MDLAEAIKKSVRFCAKGKDAPDVLRQLRFIGNYQDAPNWVHGTNGSVGSVIKVPQVPDMLMESSVAGAISKKEVQSIYLEEMLVDGKIGVHTMFRMKDGGIYQLPLQTNTAFPQVPDWPEKMWVVEDWGWVLKIVHAAGGKDALMGKERPDLECLHFLEDRVEATDRSRMAMAEVSTGLRGKVPVGVFKNWPAGEVSVGFTEGYAWFRIGDEFRYARFQEGSYASGRDLREFVPEFHDGPWMAVPTKELHGAITRALAAAPTRSVFLEFGLMQVTVRASSDDVSFEGEVTEIIVPGQIGMAIGQSAQYPGIIIDGKFLNEGLKVINTPRVRIGYREGCDRLRLESGAYIEALWHKTP